MNKKTGVSNGCCASVDEEKEKMAYDVNAVRSPFIRLYF